MIESSHLPQNIEEKTFLICERVSLLQQELLNPHSNTNIEQFFDVLIALTQECKESVNHLGNEFISNFYNRFHSVAERLIVLRRNIDDFFFISKIGRGAFGKVHLVREKTSGKVFAMKSMRKTTIITHRADFWAEREIMAKSTSPWIVKLAYCFQDEENLYMIMEFLPGGNLVSWMDEVEVLSEASCRFYTAEIALALSHLHHMGFIHRDLKPDNLLLDAGGHLKLADFGTSIKVDPLKKTVICDTAVGTPDYISPEVLLSQSNNSGEYSFEVDWWALGVLVYEMLYSETPFYSETLVNTYSNIMKYSRHLTFPSDIKVSDAAIDFIKCLLCDKSVRLGNFPLDSSRNIFDHHWFSTDWVDSQRLKNTLDPNDLEYVNWDWNNIRACVTPFQPQLNSETDTAYFGCFEEQNKKSDASHNTTESTDSFPSHHDKDFQNNSASSHPIYGTQLNFAGFSFTQRMMTEYGDLKRSLKSQKTIEGISSKILDDEHLKDGHERASTIYEDNEHVSSSLDKESSRPFNSAISKLQNQLEEQLLISEEQMAEIIRLSEHLQISESSRLTAESELASREVASKEAAESADRHLATMKAEYNSQIARLEGEVKHWQIMSECDEQTRKLLVDNSSSSIKMTTSDPKVNMSMSASNIHENTDVLVERLRQLNDRVQRSEGLRREAEEQLATEKGFTSLYKDACAEKSDQLTEMARQMANLKDNMETLNQTINRIKRENEATKRALHEEQDNVENWKQLAKTSEENYMTANKRAAMATEEATKHCSRLVQLEDELAKANKTVATEKVKCAAAVNKIRQILSGQNNEVIEMMMNSDLPITDTSPTSPIPTGGTSRLISANRSTEHAHILKQIERNNKKYSNKIQQIQLQHNNQLKEMKAKQETVQSRLIKAEAELAKYKGDLKEVQRENALLKQAKEAFTQSSSSPHNTHVHMNNNNNSCTSNSQSSSQLRDVFPVTSRSASSGLIKLKTSMERNKSSNSSFGNTSNNSNNLPDYIPEVMNKSSDTFDKIQVILDTKSQNNPANNLFRRSSLSERPATSLSYSFSKNPAFKSVNSTAMLFLASHYEEIFAHRLKNPNAILSIGGLQINIAGLLQVPSKERGRRKKLSWHTKFVILTTAEILVYDLVNSSGNVDTTVNLSNASGNQNLTLSDDCISLPLTAILHLRNVTSCDVLHATPDELPKIYQLIYDQTALITKSNEPSEFSFKAKNKTLQLDSMTDSTNSMNTHLNRSFQTNTRCNSHTLPRKMSFLDYSNLSTSLKGATTSASNLFSGGGNKSNNISKEDISVPLTRSDSSGTKINQIKSSAESQSLSLENKGTILLHGHVLQKIQFRAPVMCDLCHKACWNFINPPQALQCLHCQTKMHATHIEKKDSSLPQCAKSTAIKLFKAESEDAKNQWFLAITMALNEIRKRSSNSSLAAKSSK